ncbi:MAG: hypothetical protein KKE37_04295 [Verrucomicrobia bacterium]|nr:hypothetical protein [Verrucomicrobiota bacterium]
MDVIKPSVFVSELGNGHRVVAIERGRADTGERRGDARKIGDHVVVEVFPGDLATGRIVRCYGNGESSE